MNVTASTAANDPDRNELHPPPRREESHQRFRFNLEAFRLERQGRPGFQVNEPQSGLRVGKSPPRALRKFPAHPPVHQPSQPRHGVRVVHAVANHQPRAGLFGASQQRGQILRRVLAVAVERRGPFKTLLECLRQTGPERGAFAEISPMPDHHRARPASQARCLIGRAVVHDQNRRKILAHGFGQRRDGRPLVETGNHHRAFRRFKHGFSIISIRQESRPKTVVFALFLFDRNLLLYCCRR